MQEGKRFDELEIGDKFTTISRTITEPDIVSFVNLAGFFEELFLNMQYVEKDSGFGRRIAPGALTYAFAEGLSIQTGMLHNTGLALLGTRMRVLAPAYCNDTIQVDIEVSEKRMTHHGDRGVVTFTHTVRNQEGRAIMTYDVTRMIKK